MANDLTSNPWIVDTASATPITLDLVRISKIAWIGGTTAAHACIVTNAVGKVIFSSLGAGANHVDETSFEGHLLNAQGIAVPTLASGKVYLYYK